MTIDYSQTERLSSAIKKTLDGKHPCKLCIFISKEKKADEKKIPQKFEKRLELFLTLPNIIIYPPPFPPALSASEPMKCWMDRPPSPPPRSLII